jgi:hypothetical protein
MPPLLFTIVALMFLSVDVDITTDLSLLTDLGTEEFPEVDYGFSIILGKVF